MNQVVSESEKKKQAVYQEFDFLNTGRINNQLYEEQEKQQKTSGLKAQELVYNTPIL